MFSNPTSPPRSPIGLVTCVPSYTLSSPVFKGVTRGMSFSRSGSCCRLAPVGSSFRVQLPIIADQGCLRRGTWGARPNSPPRELKALCKKKFKVTAIPSKLSHPQSLKRKNYIAKLQNSHLSSALKYANCGIQFSSNKNEKRKCPFFLSFGNRMNQF